ncbi:UNVERIFIED_CONTAM: hypothetical protein Scaly_1779100 [Sesamum calycinum]|uniref:CCHC-type domain-containing protein n=1 Tax=Sesamum calycinum TaxID=2727403 RepID=A0AAW2NYF0_9LAMI
MRKALKVTRSYHLGPLRDPFREPLTLVRGLQVPKPPRGLVRLFWINALSDLELDFVAFDITGKNYLYWVLDVEIHLDANGLGNTIKEEKTFSTFHASNMLLQQQYHEKGFIKYFELISYLLVAEQNNELLLKNHESRPIGSAPFPEVNVATHNYYNHESYRGRGRGCSRNHSQGSGCGRGYCGGYFKNISFHQKWKNSEGKPEKENSGQTSKHVETSFYRCGGKGHWSHTCRMPKASY